MKKVVITDYEYADVEKERQIIAGAGFRLEALQCKNEQEVIDACRDADAVIVQYCMISRKVIEAMEHCRMVIKYGIGVNNIDSEAATEKGIYVCNVPDYGVDEVSNHAITLLMALSKKLPVIMQAMRRGAWGYESIVPLRRMQGLTLGLVGLGRIPKLVAKKMSNFGLKILAFDPYMSMDEAERLGVRLADFHTLCRESDYISIHCPLTEDTRHIFNKETFREMKPTALLVNTARGPVICEQDLIKALKQGEIAGAGLDVYEDEPLDKNSELLKMEQVICTPHCAWYTEDAVSAVQSKAAEEVVNVLSGNEPWNAVNRKALALRKSAG